MFSTNIQIRFADVDSLGHVNNVNLQHYFDLGKMAFYRHYLGDVVATTHESLVLVSCSTNYYVQTRMDDDIYVTTAVERVGTKSITFFQQLINRATGAVNADCRTVAVGFDFASQQSIELLPKWREVLNK